MPRTLKRPVASYALPSSSPQPGGLRSLLFGGATSDSPAADLGLLVLRVVAGLSLALLHGMGKMPPSDGLITRVGEMGLPLPAMFGWLAGTAEFGAALLIVLGLLTRPAAFLVTGNMVVVVLLAHAGDSIGDREKPLLFLAIAIFLMLAGAGRFSIDALLRRLDQR